MPFSLGTDTGGSMTIPAAVCGVVGFRPSTGRYPADGLMNISRTRDTVGVMATSVLDVRSIDAILTCDTSLALSERPVHPARLGVPVDYFGDLDDHVAKQADGALAALDRHGVQLRQVCIRDISELAAQYGFAIVAYEAPRTLNAYLGTLAPPFDRLTILDLAAGTRSPDVKELLDGMLANPVTGLAYRAALRARRSARRRFRELMEGDGLDGLIYPTVAALPPLVTDGTTMLHRGRRVSVFPTLTRHTEVGSLLGNLSVTVPSGVEAGSLPVGMTIEGIRHDDERLLRIAAVAEGAWNPAPP